ncbi:MAG TPA: 3'-5' exonuclease [Casimicrobiaceae bacterium]|nr:3'-5' exonuclease [Casimicrobiaceae bacterium]
MGILARSVDFLFGGPKVGGALGARLAAWQRMPRADLDVPHARTRYVVVDVETTGLDLHRDTLIAIGAVGVRGNAIALDDGFDAVLRQAQASDDANILIHGIGGETQLAGREPALALLDFLAYATKSPLVAFRAEFDRAVLQRAARDVLGIPLGLPFVDLAFLLPALFPGTACDSLDEWVAHFGGDIAVRHHALGDAYATAQLLLITLAAAEIAGLRSPAQLLATQKAQRWLGTRR